MNDPTRLDASTVVDWLRSSRSIDNPTFWSEIRLGRAYKEAFEAEEKVRCRELPTGVDPHDLSQTGWGVIFPRDKASRVRQCLLPLLEHRRRQAGRRFRELWHEPGELGRDFLRTRHGVAPGTLDTNKLPYYLLLVGGPRDIPFEFQYHLNINHAVGRIAFDSLEDYGSYAGNVVKVELRGMRRPRRMVIFSVENGDTATRILAEHMVRPLMERLPGRAADWRIELRNGQRASKQDLSSLLDGSQTPAFLLTSSHGKRLRPGCAEQENFQGALVCQDWRGEAASGRNQYFHAGDVAADADLRGLMVYLTGCYSAGTPILDNFPFHGRKVSHGEKVKPQAIALRPFLAQLPKTLLSRGMLAAIGHVDRGWTLSFSWPLQGGRFGEAVDTLEDGIARLFVGHRLGHALRPIYRRYTTLAAELSEMLEYLYKGLSVDQEHLALTWTALNDARNVVVLGDPATRPNVN